MSQRGTYRKYTKEFRESALRRWEMAANVTELCRRLTIQHPPHGGRRDAMVPGDLPEALSLAALTQDGLAIKVERSASDVPAFETGSAHSGLDAFDDQRAFQLSDGPDDDHNGPAQRTTGVDLLAETDELDLQMVQLIEYREEMGHRPRDPVESPDHDDIEPSAPCIAQKLIQARTFGLGAGDPVRILLHNLEAALGSKLTQIMQLRLRVLINGTHLI